MTFNHGVRSSTLRWVTKIKAVLHSGAALIFVIHVESNSASFRPRKFAITRDAVILGTPLYQNARLSSDSPMGHQKETAIPCVSPSPFAMPVELNSANPARDLPNRAPRCLTNRVASPRTYEFRLSDGSFFPMVFQFPSPRPLQTTFQNPLAKHSLLCYNKANLSNGGFRIWSSI